MKDIMIALFITVLFLMPSKAIADNVHECPSFNAVYKPHESYAPKAYDLELTFAPPLPKDPVTSREFYFHITSYKKGTDQKISMLQLASTCTLGVPVCTANTYWGQFADMEHFSNDVKSKMSFDYKLLNENFSDKNNGDAPYAVIFMHTASEFLRRMPEQSDWHHYTKFYTDEKTFPDFASYDVWIFDHCSE